MVNIRNTPLGDISPSPALVRLVLLVLVVLVLASFQLVAVAQEGDGEGSVGGKADHECDDNPSLATCPAPPPTRLSLSIRSSGGGDDFSVSYSRSTWSGSSSHRYRFELHRATSSSGSYSLYRSAWDGISPVYFSNVTGGYTYKARARRRRTYSTSTCGGYSSWSNTRTVSGGTSSTPPAPRSLSLSLSNDDFTLTWSRSSWSGSSYHYYVFELHRSSSRTSGFTSYRTVNDTLSSTPFSNVTTNRYYKARGKRCTTSSRTTCGSWSSWSTTQYVGSTSTSSPTAPSNLRLSLSNDDFTLTWSRSSWSGSSSHYYVFELHRASSSSGSYSRYSTLNDSSSPTYFNNVTRNRYYKARGKRCTTSSRTTCGSWSSWSSTTYVGPPPPSSLRLGLSSDDFTLTWSRSYWSGSSSHYYVFELHRSSSRSSGFSRYRTVNDTISSTSFSNVTTNRYYKARGKRCTTSSRTTCGSWSSWSSTMYVGPPPPSSLRLSLSSDDFTLAWSRSYWSGSSSHYYVFELHRATSSSGSFSRYSTVNDSSSSTPFSNVTLDRHYKARGKRCTSSARTTCGAWSSWSSAVYVGPLPPSGLRLSLASDDFTLSWTKSQWTGNTTNHYEFELHRSTSRTGSFSRHATVDDSSSSTPFANVTLDRHYKARGKRCTSSARTTCGAWSSWSSTVYVGPLPPSGLRLSLASDDFTLSWTQSQWTGSTTNDYVFELHRSTLRTGSFTLDESEDDSESVTSFADVDRERYYKARGKRCTTSSRNICGAWSSWSPTVYVGPAPPTGLSLSVSGDDFNVSYTGSSSNHYVFELHSSASSSGSYTRAASVNNGATSTKFTSPTRNVWYKVRGKQCASSSRTTCGEWSSWSSNPVPPLPNAPSSLALTRSTDDLTLTYTASDWSGGTGNYYKFELQQATSSTGSYSSYRTANDEASSLAFDDVKRGRWYKARGTRCTDSARTDCADWTSPTSALQVPSLPNPPTMGTGTVSGDDLSVAFTASTWSEVAGSYYEFEAHRSTTESGSYSSDSSVDDESTPVAFSDLTAGWYKVRGRRCIDSDRTECGTWSGYSNAVQVAQSAPPPTGLSLSLDGDNDIELTYARSSWTGHSSHHYEFELLRSESSSGTFSAYDDDEDSASPLDFDDVHTGYYYKARGKRCASLGKRCGDWSRLSSTLTVPAKTYAAPTVSSPTVPGNQDEMQIVFSKSTVSSLSDHHYVFELHRSDSATGTFGLSATADAEESPATFDDIDRSKVYKARGKRCKTEVGKLCGPWSSFTSVWDAPSPPSAVTLSLTNPNTLSATYTRSTTPSASTHYYQFKLIRSESATGTYADYGDIVKTTSTVTFGTVHTGYHYKALGRRCKKASTDCSEWSSSTSPSAMEVPVTTKTAPSVASTSLSTQGDDVTVNLSGGTSDRPSGQASDPNPNPSVSYFVAELRRSKTSTGTYTFYRSSNATATLATFNDVETGWFYKARARACAATVRKLCGPWSQQSAPLSVPNPTFPGLTAPTISAGLTGTIDASFTLPNASYYYLLRLRWSETGKEYGDIPNPASLAYGTTKHTFTGLTVENGGYYLAELSICSDAKRRTCGSAVVSNIVTLPTIHASPSGDIWLGEGSGATFSATARHVLTNRNYQIRFSLTRSSGSVGAARLNACSAMIPLIGKTLPATAGSSSTVTASVTLSGCGSGVYTVRTALLSGTTVVATTSQTVSVLGIPGDVRLNGDGPAGGGAMLTVRWDSVASATSYDVRYSIAFESSGGKIPVSRLIWNENTHTVSTGSIAITVPVLHKVYQVQMRSVRTGVKTAWSDPVYARTQQSQRLPFQFGPLTINKYWANGTYSYTICTETFNSQQWKQDIDAAFAIWPRYVRWMTGGSNIIAVVGSSNDCLTAGCYDNNRSTNCAPIVSASAQNRVIRAHEQGHLNRICDAGKPTKTTLACVRSVSTDSGITKTLMIFGSDDIKNDWEAGQYSNTAGQCSDLFEVALHESGHAFALADAASGDTVMVQAVDGQCRPTAIDVGGIMAAYQSIP